MIIAFSISGVGIIGVGIFPKYMRSRFDETMHVICALVGFGFGLVALTSVLWPMGILVAATTLVVSKMTKNHYNHTLSVELTLAYGIFIGLELLRYF